MTYEVLGLDHMQIAIPVGREPAAIEFSGQLVTALTAAGHDVRSGGTINGVTQTFTDDPFGNRIELVAAP